ncbi:hypothetical protein J3R30DRAFT_3511789 [Lentinula aciculospora]|uniref:DUF7330 domain-containing protein n=1 Tax=Lentinula aciculospora TaxID=153920 RepID=A0A9W9DKV9_9AGAR|nr:hypothetical protein J3R30DRAFT_3511789 [Lentinula aciculospora]
MIIPADTKGERSASNLPPDVPPKATGSPPPYTPSDAASSSSTRPFVPPDSVKPSNFMSISRTHDSCRGTYIIDPSLEIPSEYLPPLPEGESNDTRSNFYSRSVHGTVAADLYLLHKFIAQPRKKVLLTTSSTHGSVSTCIRRGDTAPSFDLKSNSKNGNVTVKIPRSYRGPVTGTTIHGRIWMSEGVSAQAVVFSEVQGVKRLFIGDMSTRNDKTDDNMMLETQHGSIRVYYEDEDSTPFVVKSVKGFWGRILG